MGPINSFVLHTQLRKFRDIYYDYCDCEREELWR